MQQQPYLPFTVEEASSVTSLVHWSNSRARVVGRLVEWTAASGRGRLVAVGEGVLASLALCFSLVQDRVGGVLEVGSLLQVLGQLEVERETPVLKVHIVRQVKGLECSAHYRAVCRIQSHLPCNIRR